MSETFTIHALQVGAGQLGLCPLPGRFGSYADDFAILGGWAPDLVLTMTQDSELAAEDAATLGDDLQDLDISWYALPITDFGAPSEDIIATWPEVSMLAKAILKSGGKVLAHCRGGCGRSGMMAMRLMVELGEAPDAALARLRAVRPCAVETEEQQLWATAPHSSGV